LNPSSCCSKLSGKWTDTHSEELKRGITIKLGYSDAVVKIDKDVVKITAGEKSIESLIVDKPRLED
jgi:translation initiation factor 2 gamma subunit (eIF-2gamma)